MSPSTPLFKALGVFTVTGVSRAELGTPRARTLFNRRLRYPFDALFQQFAF